MTVSQLQAQREELLTVLGNGALEVVLADGSRTTFADVNQLRAAIAFVDAEIAKAQSPSEPRVFPIITSRGLF